MLQRPTALGLMVCDQVIFAPGNGSPSLVGVFTGLVAEQFPILLRRFDVFASLTDGLGAGTLDLVVTQVATDQQVYVQTQQFTFPDPLQVVNMRFRVGNC